MDEAALIHRIELLTDTVRLLVKDHGRRLTRAEFIERLATHRNTFAKRLIEPDFPKPDRNGRWLLSEILDWELTKFR